MRFHYIDSYLTNQLHKQQTTRALMDQLHWFSGTPLRNLASLGGNIMNASPISDLNPVFLALVKSFIAKIDF